MSESITAEQLRARVAEGGVLRNLCLAGGDFRGVTLRHARLEQIDARNACFNDADLEACTWVDCQLAGSHFSRSQLRQVDFRLSLIHI